MFDLDRMKKALAGPSIPLPSGLPREARRKWIIAMGKGVTSFDAFIDEMEADHPGTKAELERVRQQMIEDGTMAKLKEAWLNPDNHHDITDWAQRCIMQEFIQSLPEKDRNNPISISCPCPRCTPRM